MLVSRLKFGALESLVVSNSGGKALSSSSAFMRPARVNADASGPAAGLQNGWRLQTGGVFIR